MSKPGVFCVLCLLLLPQCNRSRSDSHEDFIVPESGIEMIWIEKLGMWVGKYEITRDQFEAFANDSQYRTTAERSMKSLAGGGVHRVFIAHGFVADSLDPRFIRGLNWRNVHLEAGKGYPVECITGMDANEFCAWLTKRQTETGHIDSALEFRLPTRREWEAFASCGIDTALYPWGNAFPPHRSTVNLLDEKTGEKYRLDSTEFIGGYHDAFAFSAPTGTSPPNAWNLSEVGGNVSELVTPDSGDNKTRLMYRMGGSWACGTWFAMGIRPLVMFTDAPDEVGYVASGFRIVLAKKVSHRTTRTGL